MSDPKESAKFWASGFHVLIGLLLVSTLTYVDSELLKREFHLKNIFGLFFVLLSVFIVFLCSIFIYASFRYAFTLAKGKTSVDFIPVQGAFIASILLLSFSGLLLELHSYLQSGIIALMSLLIIPWALSVRIVQPKPTMEKK